MVLLEIIKILVLLYVAMLVVPPQPPLPDTLTRVPLVEIRQILLSVK